MGKTGVINYGSGNFTSVWNAIKHLDIDAVEVSTPESMQEVSRLILPGVGAFPAAMDRLHRLGLTEALREHAVVRGKPFLGICVGMQVLADWGYEFQACQGLGFVAGEVRRFELDPQLPVPHMGWNDVDVQSECELFRGIESRPSFYFVHSYRFEPADASVAAATCDYGESFCACVQKNRIFGVQFHPEKSQRSGLSLLDNFCSLH